MRIGIFHPFGDLPDNYSLSSIVVEQMNMILEAGHQCDFITAKWFRAQVPNGVNVRAILENDSDKTIASFGDDIGYDVIFTHDVMYLKDYAAHERVVRAIGEKNPKIKFFHWSHSAPNVGDRKTPMPNSWYVGLNRTDIPLLAKQYGVPEAKCVVIYNPVTPMDFFHFHPFTRWLVDKYSLLDLDVLMILPFDTGRLESKGAHKVAKLIKFMRDAGKKAALVCVNAAANTKDRRKIAESHHHPEDGIIYTSVVCEEAGYPKFDVFVPREVVRDLLQISNVFALLSMSEGCSLVMLEAALTKNLVVLNEDFPPLREFGEVDHVYYMKTSSNRVNTTYNPDENSYYRDWAKILIDEVEKNRVIKFNRKAVNMFNRSYIWKNQIEPLL